MIGILKKALQDYAKNPIILIPCFFLYVFLYLFSKFSVQINYKLQTTALLTGWIILFSLVSLLIMGFLFSGIIGMSYNAIKKRSRIIDMWKYGKKFWLKNFLIIVFIVILLNANRFVSHNIAFVIGKTMGLEIKPAEILFFIIYFAGLIGIIIFFTFSSFYLVIKNSSLRESLKRSMMLVKKRYLDTLIILVLFFTANSLIGLIKIKIIYEIINLLLVPYLALILSRIVAENDIRS